MTPDTRARVRVTLVLDGYRTEEVEKRGARAKKKLVVDPVEAETVKLIFRLYRHGDGHSGPLGVKYLTAWLNERGHRTRKGARFGVATVHKILTNAIYVGECVFNRRDSRTMRDKPADQWITVQVPPIIDRADSSGNAGSPSRRKTKLSAATRSGAVSTSVPSRSKTTMGGEDDIMADRYLPPAGHARPK